MTIALRFLVLFCLVIGFSASCRGSGTKSGGQNGSVEARPGNRAGAGGAEDSGPPGPAGKIDTVYVISLENTDWAVGNNDPNTSFVKDNPAAPFINKTLLPSYAHAENYHTPYHPSLPNYLSYETGGDGLGVTGSPLPFKYNGGCKEPRPGAPKDGSLDCREGFFRAPPGNSTCHQDSPGSEEVLEVLLWCHSRWRRHLPEHRQHNGLLGGSQREHLFRRRRYR